jgi:hypothetical protein
VLGVDPLEARRRLIGVDVVSGLAAEGDDLAAQLPLGDLRLGDVAVEPGSVVSAPKLLPEDVLDLVLRRRGRP